MSRKQRKQSRPRAAGKGTSVARPNPDPAPVIEGPEIAAGEERRRMVAEAAYFRAERRGFAPGAELEDWLQAEADVERLIRSGGSRSGNPMQAP